MKALKNYTDYGLTVNFIREAPHVMVVSRLGNYTAPYTVAVETGKLESYEMNSVQRKWLESLENQVADHVKIYKKS